MRRGFVLLTLIWVLVGLAALALGATLAAREAIATSRNRLSLDRAMWTAEGCVAVARALLDSSLVDVASWRRLDSVLAGRALGDCDVVIAPAGTRLDLNSASADELARLLDGLSVPGPFRDSLVAALLDWRDQDDAPRPLGAERDWYAEHSTFLPRNGPLADVRELARVRGFDRVPSLDSALDVEPGRVCLNHASLMAITALPGMSPELVSRLRELRTRGQQIQDLNALTGMVTGVALDSLARAFSELTSLATVIPDAWVLRASAPARASSLTFTIELRLASAGNRAAIVRRREW